MTVECFEDPDGTEEEILAATYRSLVKHGYADLTVKRIGDELGKSPSLVYHHFENKDALVLACLEFMLENHAKIMTDPPLEEDDHYLEEFLAWTETAFDNEDMAEFLALLIDLRSQAIHNDSYRNHFTESDPLFRDHFAEVLRVKQEEVSVEDQEAAAELLLTLLLGIMVRGSTTSGSDWGPKLRAGIEEYLFD